MIMSMAKYQATAFHESLPGGRAVGELFFVAEAIRFEPEDSSQPKVEWPLSAVEIRSGGAADRLVLITNSSAGGWCLQTPDRSILEDEVLSGHPDTSATRGRRRTHVFVGGSVILTALIAIVLSFAWVVQKRDVLAAEIVERIPIEWDQKLGDAAFKQIELLGKLEKDPEINALFQELAEPLLVIAKEGGQEIHLSIADDETVNAFALPGGHVIFNSGLIKRAGRAAEVQGVLGHEIAHVTQRHSVRNLVRSLGLFFLVQSAVGDISGVFSVLIDNSSLLLSQAYSRTLENEADEVGFKYLTQAQIDPKGMVDFFQRLKESQKESLGDVANSQALALLSTHPATQDRIDHLRKLTSSVSTPNLPEQNKFDLAFQKLKSKLSK